MVDIEQFKEGIFNSHTRRFGTIAEIMIKNIYGMENSNTLAFDKYKEDKKIEIKFSRVLKEHDETINENNIISQIMNTNYFNRKIKTTDNYNYDCNIQQIKPNEFDDLYYGLFFDDKIEIYKLDNITVQQLPNYSTKQHRGNTGEGQFHLNQSNRAYHYNNFLIKELDYNELYNILRRK